MARGNDATVANFFRLSSNMGLTDYPCTISCWFWPEVSARFDIMVEFTEAAAEFNHISLHKRSTNVLTAEINTEGSGQSDGAETANTFNITAWNHCAGVFATSTDRRSYLNGDIGNQGSNVSDHAFPATNVDRTSLGFEDDLGQIPSMDGQLCEVGFWDVELTENEVVSLAAGVSPIRIRPDGLLAYWPLHGVGAGDEPDYSGNGRTQVEQGTMTVVGHAPVRSPFSLRVPSLPFGGQIAGIDRRVGLGEIVGNVGHGE